MQLHVHVHVHVHVHCACITVMLCSHFSFQEKEVAQGGAAPRLMSIDDYFVVENEKMEKDPDTGKIVKKTVHNHFTTSRHYCTNSHPSCHASSADRCTSTSSIRTWRTRIESRSSSRSRSRRENCHFSFIVVDAVFDRAQHVDEFCTAAKVHAYQVFDVTHAFAYFGMFI